MKIFLLDLWEDLRQKRLWPVAALLLVAVIALPVVLLKPERDPVDATEVAAPTAGAASEAEQALVRLAGDAIGSGGSALDIFDPKDPFRPRGRTAKELAEATDDAGTGAGPGSETPAEEKPAEGGGGSDAPAGGGSGGEGGSGGGGGDASPPKPAEPVSYTHTIDVRFGRRGAARTYRGAQRLDVFPRSGMPALVYMGVSATGKSAIFLLDASLEQHGDGLCKPSPEECTFLYLTVEKGHDLHFVTMADGREYAIRLLEIRKERTSVVAKRAKARQARARRARTAHGRRKKQAGGHNLFFPRFAADEQTSD